FALVGLLGRSLAITRAVLPVRAACPAAAGPLAHLRSAGRPARPCSAPPAVPGLPPNRRAPGPRPPARAANAPARNPPDSPSPVRPSPGGSLPGKDAPSAAGAAPVRPGRRASPERRRPAGAPETAYFPAP